MELTKNQKYYLNNKDKFLARNKARRLAGLDKKNLITERKSAIKRKYNLNWNEFIALCERANYKCEICEKPLQLAGKKDDAIESASIDHCHLTNKIRGILCRSCNIAIGHFKDNRLHIKRALDYLDNYGTHG